MALAFGHTPHINKQTELIVASFTTNIVLRENYGFVGPQNDPTFHEHATKGLHVLF
jgi:hypothetical protein